MFCYVVRQVLERTWNLLLHHLAEYLAAMECVGKLIGKALAEGILLDVDFAPFFLTKVLSRPTTCTLNSRVNYVIVISRY